MMKALSTNELCVKQNVLSKERVSPKFKLIKMISYFKSMKLF